MREIKISPVLNGWIVNVGCGTVVFTDIKKMTGELIRYYAAPEKVENEYMRDAINKPGPLPGPNIEEFCLRPGGRTASQAA